MKNAAYSVVPITGGRSSWFAESAAYCPTPCSEKIASVRIAPPPMAAAKSSPKSVTTGMSALRSTWRSRTRRSLSPLARAVRT